jgi:hypothetical protein
MLDFNNSAHNLTSAARPASRLFYEVYYVLQ